MQFVIIGMDINYYFAETAGTDNWVRTLYTKAHGKETAEKLVT